MAHFYYKDQNPRYKKGVALRIHHLPENVRKEFNKLMRKGEELERVYINEVNKKYSKVLLEGWSRTPLKDPYGKRFTVTYVLVDEDPDWVCESDFGRGYKAKKN